MNRKTYLPNLPLATGIIKRAQLNQKFAESLRNPLVTITTPPGFGKTTMLANYLSKITDLVMWISLSSIDNDENFFWKHMSISASYEIPFLAKTINERKFPEKIEEMSEFLIAFLEYSIQQHDKDANKDIVVVYDNYEQITNKKVLKFIQSMPSINTVLAGLRIHQVVVSNDLLANLTMQTSQPLLEGANSQQNISTNDFRFTEEEVNQLFQIHNDNLDDSTISELEITTEGWPMYLYLLATEKKPDFASTREALYHLFENNYYSNYSANVQKILMELSIFKNLSSTALSNLVAKYSTSEDGSENYDAIRKNPFLEYSIRKDAYFFMAPYHDFLTSKINTLDDEKKIPILNVALDYSFEYNDIVNVVDPYYRTKDYDGMMHCLTIIAPYKWSEGDCRKILNYLYHLPKDYSKRNPWTDYFRAIAYFKNCYFEKADLILHDLLKKLDENDEAQQSLIGECYCALAVNSLFLNRCFDLSLFDKINAYLPSGSILMSSRTYGISENSFFYMPLNKEISLEDMVDYIYKFNTQLTKVSNGCLAGFDYLFEAEANLYQGNVNQAAQLANQAIFKAHTEDQLDIVLNGYNVLVRAALLSGNYSLVSKHISAMDKYYSKYEQSALSDLIELFHTFYALEFRDLNNIPDWIKNTDLKRYKKKVQVQGRNILVSAFYALGTEDYARFHALIDELNEVLGNSGFWTLRVFMHLLYAISYTYQDEKEKALDAFYACYSMTYSKDFFYPLIELKESLFPILDLVKESQDKRFDLLWIQHLEAKTKEFMRNLDKISREKDDSQHERDTRQYMKLTKRETQVLKLLANGLSRSEIAANLNISVSGVQKFLSNIYLKLGAKNGTDAVSIAYSLEII